MAVLQEGEPEGGLQHSALLLYTPIYSLSPKLMPWARGRALEKFTVLLVAKGGWGWLPVLSLFENKSGCRLKQLCVAGLCWGEVFGSKSKSQRQV